MLSCITMSEGSEQAITHTRECRGDSESINNHVWGKPEQHNIHAPSDRLCMSIFHNDIIGMIRDPPLPSAHLKHDTTRWAICGWPVHYLGEHL
jgi:hypothetical protein